MQGKDPQAAVGVSEKKRAGKKREMSGSVVGISGAGIPSKAGNAEDEIIEDLGIK